MSTSTHTRADSPFDSDGDLILQTSDDVDFRVHKLILRKASPTFDNILSLPHPSPEHAAAEDYIDGIPVISVTESSDTMDIFLRYCYPTVVPTFDLPDFLPLFRAGKKYEADVVIENVLIQFRRRFCSHKAFCVRAFVIACHLGLQEETKCAAKTSLSIPGYQITQMRFKELDLVPASTFFNLLDYHRRCRDTIVQELCSPTYWVNRFEDFTPMFELSNRSKKCCTEVMTEFYGALMIQGDDEWPDEVETDVRYTAKLWAMQYLMELGKLVDNDKILIEDAFHNPEAADRAVERALECPRCSETVVGCLMLFVRKAVEAVDDVVSKVS